MIAIDNPRDPPSSVAECWHEFEDCLEGERTESELTDMKHAFYAGAQAGIILSATLPESQYDTEVNELFTYFEKLRIAMVAKGH